MLAERGGGPEPGRLACSSCQRSSLPLLHAQRLPTMYAPAAPGKRRDRRADASQQQPGSSQGAHHAG